MKRKLLYSLLVGLLMTTVAMAQVTVYRVTGVGAAVSPKYGASFTNSTVDTVIWVREKGVTSLAFSMYANDTVEVTTARVLRSVGNNPAQQGAAAEGDTLTNLTALDQTTAAAIALGITTLDAITLAPLADQYWVIIQYNASGNGVAGSLADYKFIKEYGK